MTPDYKRVKILMPHCPKCKEQLSGNNSIITPWKCSCGTWKMELTNQGDYEVKI